MAPHDRRAQQRVVFVRLQAIGQRVQALVESVRRPVRFRQQRLVRVQGREALDLHQLGTQLRVESEIGLYEQGHGVFARHIVLGGIAARDSRSYRGLASSCSTISRP